MRRHAQCLSGKESACNARDVDAGWSSGLTRSRREGNGNLLQYSCLENPTDKGAWRATVHGVTKSRTQLKWLNMQHKGPWRAPSWMTRTGNCPPVSVASAEEPAGSRHSAEPTGRWWQSKCVRAFLWTHTHTHTHTGLLVWFSSFTEL